MLDRVSGLPATWLPLNAYRADFAAAESRAMSSWKLERRQTFTETDEPSWDAAVKGDWAAAMRLAAEDEHSDLGTELRAQNARGLVRRRLRIVEEPISYYLRWELPSLAVLARLGEQVTIGSPELVQRYETDCQVPEIIGLDDAVMYEIVYDERDVLAGGRRITDSDAVATCHRVVLDLWRQGEEIVGYVEQKIAPLVPFLP